MSRTQISAVLMLTAIAVFGAGLSAYFALRFYERSLQAQFPIDAVVQGRTSAQTVFVGDSRVAEWAEHDRLKALYVAFPGATASQIAAAARTFNWPAGISTIVIQAGVNDLRILGLRPELRDGRVAASHGDLVALVDECLKHAREVILLLILPTGEPGLLRKFVWSGTVAEGVELLNRKLESTRWAGAVRVVDAEQELGVFRETMFRDELHFSAEAYEALNGIIHGVIGAEQN